MMLTNPLLTDQAGFRGARHVAFEKGTQAPLTAGHHNVVYCYRLRTSRVFNVSNFGNECEAMLSHRRLSIPKTSSTTPCQLLRALPSQAVPTENYVPFSLPPLTDIAIVGRVTEVFRRRPFQPG